MFSFIGIMTHLSEFPLLRDKNREKCKVLWTFELCYFRVEQDVPFHSVEEDFPTSCRWENTGVIRDLWSKTFWRIKWLMREIVFPSFSLITSKLSSETFSKDQQCTPTITIYFFLYLAFFQNLFLLILSKQGFVGFLPAFHWHTFSHSPYLLGRSDTGRQICPPSALN